ncbi:hypothetical protein MTsPCn9_24760 [Croceitalea sp. MTPC9]|uniref:hypothetical protein n=1 Tax=unclassified Croceitalea TaxID=2632280 RepID=UPI002B3BE4C9|nr:hypothetical protein MTsPCn6_18770 [Croceitalea sp. MTPC6]GMN17538.1 hypothetical protein MTsPCn9_24760 [Croceitalea sp. MTPC9]
MTTTPNKIVKTISIIHLALLAGPLLTGAFFYLNTEINTSGNTNDIFIYIFPMIALAGIFASKVLYRLFLNPLKQKEQLRDKLAGLQSASLIQYALIEGPAFLNIVWFSQTGNLLYLTVGGVLLIYLFILRPTKTKIENDLELKGEHKRQFNKGNEPL